MARKINAGENVGRSDMFLVDPREVIVDPNLRARWAKAPPGPDAVRELVEDFLANGQSNPCVARMQASDKRLIIEQGQTRHAAALWIVENKDKNWRLKVTIGDRNEEEGFVCAIQENRVRTDTSPVDDAFNMRALRDRYGWDDKRICAFYKIKSPVLRDWETLLTLPDKVLHLVHGRKLSVANAVLLAGLAGSELSAALKEAQAAPATRGGRVNPSAVRQAVRSRKGSTNGHVARTLKDVRSKFTTFSAREDIPPKARDLGTAILRFISGESNEAEFDEFVAGLFSKR